MTPMRSLLLLISMLASAVLHAAPPRIVSLAPHLTELTYAAGAGEYLVATIEFSDYPEAARALPRIGDSFRIDHERLLALKPTHVLAWNGGTPTAMIQRIRDLGFPVEEFQARELAHVPQTIERIGAIAGTEKTAQAASREFTHRVRDLRERFARRTPIDVFVQVNSQPLYTVSGDQIISEVVTLCGGRNIFADLRTLAPLVSVEAVLARKPQVILSTDQRGLDAGTQWRAWKVLPAVRAGAIYTLEADELTRAGYRLPTAIEKVCAALDDARQRLGLAVK
jgi:iron complex transport system substrate-binding protein